MFSPMGVACADEFHDGLPTARRPETVDARRPGATFGRRLGGAANVLP
jgi:hypothetical protein